MIRGNFRTARKQYACDGVCHYATIKPGDRYYASAASPNHDDLGNSGWWHLRLCVKCAESFKHTDPDVSAACDAALETNPGGES